MGILVIFGLNLIFFYGIQIPGAKPCFGFGNFPGSITQAAFAAAGWAATVQVSCLMHHTHSQLCRC
jgi:hypothetical protein